ncbi:hypothetical protein LOTGIDRAFT_176831, partial [Lottia gigantea]
ASVLDRLNALLEPGGVLSVNERGVIDGQIPTIKPHPNFRLFLAMDSKYGEISRAMRNRGVEIYIPGEVDGCTYSRLDILSMLEGIGIRSYSIKHWLISVHDSVKQELPYTEKPTITDLLRCGVVVKQQLDKGMPLIQSLQQAAHDVYLRSLKTNSSKKHEFPHLKQKTPESIDDYSHRLSRKCDQAYPSFSKANKLTLCAQHFVEGLYSDPVKVDYLSES